MSANITPVWAAFDGHDKVKCPNCKNAIGGWPDTSTEPGQPFKKICSECGTVVHYAVRKAHTSKRDIGGNFRI